MGMEAEVEDTTAKEYTRTKTSWAGERKTILTEDDEETLSSKHLHGAFKGAKISRRLRSVSGVYSRVN